MSYCNKILSFRKMAQKELIFPEFDSLEVSTKTYTALPNFKINLLKLFDIIPITPYTVIKKKRGRKPKCDEKDPNSSIKSGSFISVKFKDKIRGINLKNGDSCMRNSMAMDIIFDKRINFKIYCNGTFQLTGCKTYRHTVMCIERIWEIIKDVPDIYEIPQGELPEAIIVPAMRNVDFELGFKVDREKMMYEKKNFSAARCHLDVNCTYTGITVKIPLQRDILSLETLVIKYQPTGEWTTEKSTYSEYIKKLPKKSMQEKMKKKRFNTFFVFYSGSTVMTGPCREFMREDYYTFTELIKSNYLNIVENLKPQECVSDGDIFSDNDDISSKIIDSINLSE